MTFTIPVTGPGTVTITATFTPAQPTPPPLPTSSRKLIAAYLNWRDWTGVGNAPGDPGTWTDGVIAYMASLGLKGLMVSSAGLHTLGGPQDWTVSPTANESAAAGSSVVARCRAHGITKLYLGAGSVNPSSVTPYAEWFNDAAWTPLLAEIRALAAAAKRMGFDGVWWDNETPKYGVTNPTWAPSYPGNTRSEVDTRAQVALRGRQVMGALVAGFGTGIEVVNYHSPFNGGYSQKIRPGADFDAESVQIDFHNGMTSVPGWGHYRFANADFYLGASLADMRADVAGVEANLAAKWGRPISKVAEVPFLWLGPSNGDGGGFYTPDRISPSAGLAAAKAAYQVSPDEFYSFFYVADPNHANFSAFTPAAPVSWPTPGNFEPAWRAAAGVS